MNVDEKREKILDQISPYYSPHLHLVGNFGFALILVCISIFNMGTDHLWSLPISFLVFLGVEWALHKYLLHRPTIKRFYDFHTNHHILYTHDRMKIGSMRELSWVLIPQDLFFLFGSLFCLLSYFVSIFHSDQLAYTIVFGHFAFYLFYETCHLLWHLLPENRISQYHTFHHNLANMHKWNFNVTIPIVDLVVRTLRKKK